MLRDAVAHREPEEGASGGLAARYAARQRCIEATPFGRALGRLRQTAGELAGKLAAEGIVLPELPTGPVVG
jgi:hypothetical protein